MNLPTHSYFSQTSEFGQSWLVKHSTKKKTIQTLELYRKLLKNLKYDIFQNILVTLKWFLNLIIKYQKYNIFHNHSISFLKYNQK